MLENANEFSFVIIAFAVSAFISFASTPLVKRFAEKIGAVDVPRDARRMHKAPIPRLGGLAIFFGFLVTFLIMVPLDQKFIGILIGAVIIILLGVVDDIKPLSAKVKMAGQILAALFPVLFGVRVDAMTNFLPLLGGEYIIFGFLAIPLTVFWIVGVTNAVNLIDGLDGLAVGVSSIACISMLLISILLSEGSIILIIAALAGGCIGFMPYNLNPAKIFMGDTGAMFLGYMLGVLSILGLFKFYTIVSFAVPFLILGLPIFDTAFAIIRRLLKGKSPMAPDRGHLHHRLIDKGFSQKQTVAILYSMSAVLGLSAVVMTGSGVFKALLLIASVLVVSFIAYKIFDAREGRDNDEDGDEDEK